MNYLIIGESYKLIDIEIKKIVGTNEYKTYSLDEVSINEVLEDASYTSLFNDAKFLVVKNFEVLYDTKKDDKRMDSILDYLNNDGDTTLIFVAKSKMPSKTKVCKEIQTKLKIIETPIISKSYELNNILRNIIKKDGYGISENALTMFSNKCVCNIDVAINEFEKLKLYKGNNLLITETDIEEFVPNYNSGDMFELKDAIINKNLGRANELLDIVESSKMELIPLVVMLSKEYETLYVIKSLALEKKNNDDISSIMGGIHPYRVKLLRECSNKYNLDDIKRHILYLCNLDKRMVSEDNLGILELKKFLLEL